MQQYFQVDEGSGTLTIFHTDEMVSFDMEFYGGYSISDERLFDFLTGEEQVLEVRQEERRRPSVTDEDSPVKVGWLEKDGSGSVTVNIDTSKISSDKRPVEIELTREQVETLIESITVGSVERLEDGKYPVEWVPPSGERERA